MWLAAILRMVHQMECSNISGGVEAERAGLLCFRLSSVKRVMAPVFSSLRPPLGACARRSRGDGDALRVKRVNFTGRKP